MHIYPNFMSSTAATMYEKGWMVMVILKLYINILWVIETLCKVIIEYFLKKIFGEL